MDENDIEQIARLTNNAAWQAIRNRYQEELRPRLERRLTSLLFAGGPTAAAADQRLIDYTRGFLDGAEWTLDNPAKALDRLKNMADRNEQEEE